QVGVAAGLHRQVGPVYDGRQYAGGRHAEPFRAYQRLRGAHAGAYLGTAMVQADAALRVDLDAREGRFGARPEIFLHTGEADAVALAGVLGLVAGLLLGAPGPHRVGGRLAQDLVGPHGASRYRALGVLHAGLQYIAQAELDGVEPKFGGDFVDHHFGGRHALQGAVAARRAGVDGAAGDRHGGQVALGDVVDGLRRGGAHHGDRRREIGAAAAVGFEMGLECLHQAGLAVHGDAVAHVEGVALERGLELLVAVVGDAHRPAVAVEGADHAVERHVAVVLRAVADGVAGVQEHLEHRGADGRGHFHRTVGHFLGRLGRHHHVQGLRGGVVPAVGIVGLERRRVDGLRLVTALQHQPVAGRGVELGGDAPGVVHALLAELAVV